ncbi:lipoyltransferase [Chiua virens]|nr:lipoyltransferase [Chiua virens]
MRTGKPILLSSFHNVTPLGSAYLRDRPLFTVYPPIGARVKSGGPLSLAGNSRELAEPTHSLMSLPPVFYHYFRMPLPYARTFALQERIHQIQLTSRRTSSESHHDILLLLQHRPVYTSGRRQTEDELEVERTRLTKLGADFVTTSRGGQLTYHGPGQLVGYPLLDLARTSPPVGIREYICKMQRTIQHYLSSAHNLPYVPSEHTGVFLDPATKVASIGVQVRHRLTTHGFAMNVTQEPLVWFDQVVACGLADVRAGCIALAAAEQVQVHDVVEGLVDAFGRSYGRIMKRLELETAGEVGKAIVELEKEALEAGDWSKIPTF